MKLTNSLIAVLVVVVSVFGFLSLQPHGTLQPVGVTASSIQNSLTTNASTTVGTTAVKILTAKTGRLSAKVCNNSTSTLAWATAIPAAYTTVTSTVGAANYFTAFSGEALYFGSCYKLGSQNMNYGNIWAIRAAGTETISSEEQVVN